MKFFFTLLILLFSIICYGQSGTLSLGTSTSICANGCNASGAAPYCNSCGTNASGNCTEYELTSSVTIAPGETVSITVTNADCGSAGSFDTSDEIIFRYNNGVEIVYAGGASGVQTATRCFDNPITNKVGLSVIFGYRANRRDEFVNYTYTISSGTGSGCLVLPVSFSSFVINKLDNHAILNFTTASETNNDYFTIERSGDGRSYDAIGEIDGAGDSRSEIKYTFTDERPLPGINYYRIKQTDFDGRYDYSEVRAVRHSSGNLVVTPRTTEGRLQVVTDAVDYSLEVYNTSGQLVKSLSSLSQDQSISIEDLTAGIYYIRTISGRHTETIRIVKM